MPVRVVFGFALALIVTLPQQRASAAPQILAVLATAGGIPFACGDGLCEADLSTFCLQRHRTAPDFGTAYVPAAPGDFTLVVTDANGGRHRLPAAGHVTFVERRGYTAVAARLPEEVLAGLGAVSAAIEVGANASLLPAPRNGDPDPLTSAEIALAVGPWRALGTRLVDGSPDAEAALVLATMINMLPRQGRIGAERDATLWADATGHDPSAATENPGLSRAWAEYDWCIGSIQGHRDFSLRGCLERRHDRLLRDLNDDYWNAEAGS
ncbi:MAG: hypothetical protein ACE5KF_08420 [Kiloniellaceae bacterium]